MAQLAVAACSYNHGGKEFAEKTLDRKCKTLCTSLYVPCLFMRLVSISRTQSNNRELTSVAMADDSKVFANDKATG